ncbi:MAG TPA: hypothetical protein VNU19_21725 [Candidatus Acidoferrum sp.]|jgi:hypothetical protein|nr:hypothetical protein [Candidatus Acidoferrum sp.]
MADYQTYVTDLQNQFLAAIQKVGEVQAKLIEAVRDVPATLESGQLTPAELVEKSYNFATQVLDTQREMTLRLINAAGGTSTKTRAKQAV